MSCEFGKAEPLDKVQIRGSFTYYLMSYLHFTDTETEAWELKIPALGSLGLQCALV